MEKIMKKFMKSSMITSTILIILGILLIFQSETTVMAISYIIGGILMTKKNKCFSSGLKG